MSDSNDPTRDPSQDDPPESGQTTRTSHTTSSAQDRIGPYRILEQVGSGGMGEVYRAEQTEPIRRTVALKIIKRGMDTKEVVTRFEAERQALALMDHPNIAKVFDAGSTPQGRPYFAMEYVKGIPITTYCDEHKLSMRQRLELFMQLCEGVQHAHQKAIIHRDLKPSNVLVTIQGDKPVPKIIDFGVAKATAQKLTENTMYTALGEMIGTPEYMSPEQAALTGEDIDTRTDVYALGVILYELLAGALPFDAKELRKAGFEGIVRMIREQDPPRPSTKAATLGERGTDVAKARRTIPGKLTSQLRGDLDWITMKALEKDRTRRYGSPSDMAADVRRHLRHEPVLAGPPSAGYRMGKFVRRHRTAVGVVGVVFLSIVLGFAESNRQRVKAETERVKAETARDESDAATEFLVSVFNVSDPGEARGNSITAREVLDNGADRIQRELRDQPLLRAKMMDSMGRVYDNLGLYSNADSLLVGALELHRSELGEEHLGTVETLSHLGWLRMHQGRFGEAKEIHEQAFSVRERELGAEHVDTARSMHRLGICWAFLGERPEGRRWFERALPILEKELGPEHLEVAWCINDIGLTLNVSHPDSALTFFEQSLEIKTKVLGPDHPDVARSHDNVGEMLMRLDRLAEARPHLEQALAISRKSLGPEHYDVGNALTTFGELLHRQGHHRAAADTLRRAFQIISEAVDPGHWIIRLNLRHQARVAVATGAHTEADSLYRRALENVESFDPDSAWLANVLYEYAKFLRDMSRVQEAEAMEARATAIREKLKQSSEVN